MHSITNTKRKFGTHQNLDPSFSYVGYSLSWKVVGKNDVDFSD